MRLIRIKEVRHLTGLSTASVYRKVKANEFPQSISLGARTVGWVESEVLEWVESRIAGRGKENTGVQS